MAAGKKKATKRRATKKTKSSKRAKSEQRNVRRSGSDASRYATSLVSAIQKKRAGSRKRKGFGSIQTLDQDEGLLGEVTEWIPSGFSDLDRILGGGWAVGRASEVYGPEGAGKSATSHMAIRECQRQGGVAVLQDLESALDKRKLRKLGIDTESLVLSSPLTAEEAWGELFELIELVEKSPPEAPLLFAVDSLAAMVPKKELEIEMEDATVGLAARINSRGCRRAYRAIAGARMHLMWINQQRQKIGAKPWEEDKSNPGGAAISYAASQRVKVQVASRLKVKKEAGSPVVGYLVRTTTQKCRLAPPHQQTNWILSFRMGPSPELTARHLLDAAGILKAGRPGWVKLPNGATCKKTRWLHEMRESDDFSDAVDLYMEQLIAAGGVQRHLAREAGEDVDAE